MYPAVGFIVIKDWGGMVRVPRGTPAGATHPQKPSLSSVAIADDPTGSEQLEGLFQRCVQLGPSIRRQAAGDPCKASIEGTQQPGQ